MKIILHCFLHHVFVVSTLFFRSENHQNPGLEHWTTVQSVELEAALTVGAVLRLPNPVLLVWCLTLWLHCLYVLESANLMYLSLYLLILFYLCLLVDHGTGKGRLMHKKENGTSPVLTSSVPESSTVSSNPPRRPTVPRWYFIGRHFHVSWSRWNFHWN